jgi:hypothetical protein
MATDPVGTVRGVVSDAAGTVPARADEYGGGLPAGGRDALHRDARAAQDGQRRALR